MGRFRFLRRSHRDRERSAELESYLQIETDDNIARGRSPEQARSVRTGSQVEAAMPTRLPVTKFLQGFGRRLWEVTPDASGSS